MNKPALQSGHLATGTHRHAVSIEDRLVDINKEIVMVDREAKRAERLKKAKDEYEQWQEASKAHWSHWRAWGSWFSWGSPVGLGLFFVLAAVATAILIWASKL